MKRRYSMLWNVYDRTRVRLGLRWLTEEIAQMDKEKKP